MLINIHYIFLKTILITILVKVIVLSSINLYFQTCCINFVLKIQEHSDSNRYSENNKII